jgi:hypothetical protein
VRFVGTAGKTMPVRLLMILFVLATVPTVTSAAEVDKKHRDELMNLYLISVGADRCGFAMSAREADAVEKNTNDLVKTMRLGEKEADEVYSEADLAFQKKMPKACERDGDFARFYRDTLHKVSTR